MIKKILTAFMFFIIFAIPQVSLAAKNVPYKVYSANSPIVLITIDPKYTDKSDMHILGQELKTKYKNSSFIRVSIFTSSKAAKLWNKVLDDSMTSSEENFYDTNYVGQYNKNKSSGLNTYAIYYGGLNGKQEIIKY